MRIAFNLSIHNDFFLDDYRNIIKEAQKRGHTTEIVKQPGEYDFTISADEAMQSLGGKNVWIGHGFEAKTASLCNERSRQNLINHSDYIFVYSEYYKDFISKYYNKPIFVTGMAKLDGLFNIEKDHKTVLYAPTFNEELSADTILGDKIEQLSNITELIIRRHPFMSGFRSNEISHHDALKKASVVISDYSSIGMEALVLEIPTILVNNPKHSTYPWFPSEDYICNMARKATIKINNYK